MPSADTIAGAAADMVAYFINTSDKEAQIAKYGTYADELTKVQAKITSWLRDGKISEDEKAELKRALLPLAQKIEEAVK